MNEEIDSETAGHDLSRPANILKPAFRAYCFSGRKGMYSGRDQYAVPGRDYLFSDACRGAEMQKLLPMITLPELVTVPEAAKFLGVGRKVVYQMLDSGILRAIRIKRKIFIDPCCLNEFHNRGKMA